MKSASEESYPRKENTKLRVKSRSTEGTTWGTILIRGSTSSRAMGKTRSALERVRVRTRAKVFIANRLSMGRVGVMVRVRVMRFERG